MPKKPIFGELAKLVTMRLYSWEKQPIKQYIKQLREKKRKELKEEKKGGRIENKKLDKVSSK